MLSIRNSIIKCLNVLQLFFFSLKGRWRETKTKDKSVTVTIVVVQKVQMALL